jgi:hypothetical protein
VASALSHSGSVRNIGDSILQEPTHLTRLARVGKYNRRFGFTAGTYLT